MASSEQNRNEAVAAHKKALLAERPYISDDIALPAMHDRAAKIAEGKIPATFDEDIYVVLFANQQHRRGTAVGYGFFGVVIVLIGIATFIWVGSIHFGFKIAIVGAGGWLIFTTLEQIGKADETFWAFIEYLSAEEAPNTAHGFKFSKRTDNVFPIGGFDVPPQDRDK